VALKGPARAEAGPGEEDHEDRQLENEAEGEDKEGDKGDEAVDGDERLELGRLETQEEIDAIGQGDVIAETGAAVEKKRGEENEPEDGGGGQAEGPGQGPPEPGDEDRRQRKAAAARASLTWARKGSVTVKKASSWRRWRWNIRSSCGASRKQPAVVASSRASSRSAERRSPLMMAASWCGVSRGMATAGSYD
jgi:hypothetical protein